MPSYRYRSRSRRPGLSPDVATPLAQAYSQEAQAAQQVDQAAREQDTVRQIEDDLRQKKAVEEKFNLGLAKRQGALTQADPATGKEVVQRDETGNPVYEAGFLGGPKVSNDGKPVVEYRDPRGKVNPVPLDGIQRTEDPTGETFYEFNLDGQKVRRPEEKANPLFKIDPATGKRFTETTDPTTGAIVPQPLGIDPKAANQAAINRRKAEYAKTTEARKFQADELRLQQQVFENEYKPIKEQLSEAEKAAKDYADPEAETERYEQRQDGLYRIEKAGRATALPIKLDPSDPASIASGQNWLRNKKQAEDRVAQLKAEHDPRAAQLAEMQAKRDRLALEALRESNRVQTELSDMEEADKAGLQLYKPEWRKKLDASRKDARYQQIVAAGDFADSGSDLADDISRVDMPSPDGKPAPVAVAQKILKDAADSPRTNYTPTDAPVDLAKVADRTNERSILDVLTSGLTAGKEGAPEANDVAQARELAAKSLGVTDPEAYSVTQAENGGFNLFRAGSDTPIGRLDPNAKQILVFPSEAVTEAGQELLTKATKDGFPVYRMGGGTPMTAQELRDYVAKGVNIARGAGSQDEKAAMLAKEGITPTDVRERVFSGKMSVQDGRWLQEKLFDAKEVDTSAEGYAAGLREYLAQNPAQAALFSNGQPEDKAAVVNKFADNRTAQAAENNLFSSLSDHATRRAELLQQHAGKGALAKAGGLVKEVLVPMTGMLAQAGMLVTGVPTLMTALGHKPKWLGLAEESTVDFLKRAPNYLTRINEREGMVFAVDELRAWADRARPGEKPPEELAARIAKEVYNGYHELTPEAAKALETSEDTFNVNKDPALSAMMQRYLSTGNDADLSGMLSMLAMDAKDRKSTAALTSYAEAPRAATPDVVLERMKPFGLNLDPKAAADLLAIRQTVDSAKDPATAAAAMVKAQKILGTSTPEDTALAFDTLTMLETDDPDSVKALFKGGLGAGFQETATEVLSTGLEIAVVKFTGGLATPEILAARAARTAAKTGVRAALKRSVGASLDALTNQSRLFAATRSAFNRGRLALGETITKESDKFAKAGMLTEKFGVPLTGAQKARNFAVGTAKAAAAAAPIESVEEGIVSIGEVDASIEATIQQMGMGAMGGGLIAPIFAGATAIGNLFTSRRAGREMEKQKAGWVEKFNERMSKAPGFKPVSIADYDTWQGLQDNPAHQEAFGEYSTALQDLQAAQETQVEGQPPAPAVLAAQARAESASAKLENLVEVSFSAMDELRAIPEAERPLYTAAAKAAAGARDFTEAEAKALIKQSGNNAAVFQQAETMPAGVQGPRQLKTLADLPEVSTVAPGVYRLPEGAQITLPPALVDTLKQAAPTMVDLMAVSATVPNAATIQPNKKGAKGAKLNNPAPTGNTAQTQPASQPGAQAQPTGFESFGTVAPAAKGGISVTTTDKAQHAALQKELRAQGIKFAATGTKAKGKGKASYTISFKPKAVTPQAQAPATNAPQAQAPAQTPQQAAGAEQVARRVIADTVTRAPKLKGIIKEASKPLKWETGGFWANADGTVSFHMPTLLPQLAGLDAQTAAKRVAALIDEEIRHVANMEAAKRLWKSGGTNPLGLSFKDWRDAWYGDIWDNHFTDDMRARVEEAYGDTLPPEKWMRAMEGLRMLDQLRATGSITEAVLRHLEAVIEALREFLTAATPKIKQEIENIRAVLAEYGYEGGTVKPEKAKKKASKPKEKSTPKSSTQFTLSPADAKPILDFGKSIPKDELFDSIDPEWSNGALEDEPHVTVLYGLTKHEAAPVAKAIANHGPVTITLGKLSIFDNPEYDVLKVDIEGADLRSLNAKLSKLPNDNTFPDYKPHMTIAYLKKGEGKKYVGDARFEGQEITFDTMTFSPPKDLRGKIGKPELPLVEAKQKPTAGVPMMVTRDMRQQLSDLGYSKSDIAAMKPEEAQGLIAGQTAKASTPTQKPAAKVDTPETGTKTPAESPPQTVKPEQSKPDAIDTALGDAFSGLFSAPAQPLTQTDLPKDRRDAMMKAASAVIDLGLKTPTELAQRLDKLALNGALRQYSRAFWRLMSGFDSTLEESPDWSAIYAGIDAPAVKPVPKPKKAPKLGSNPLEEYDLLDFLADNPIELPPADQQTGKGEYDQLKNSEISRYYRQFITKPVTQARGNATPDVRAQEAYDYKNQDGTPRPLIASPDADTLINSIVSAIANRQQTRAEIKRRDRREQEMVAQMDRFNRDKADGGQPIDLNAVRAGDSIILNGENLEIAEVQTDEDGYTTSITLRDHTKYGIQRIGPDELLLVDEYIPRPRLAPVAEDDFGLAAETEEEMQARLAREDQQRRLQERASRPLAGEFGTPDLLDTTAGDMALFNQPLASAPASTMPRDRAEKILQNLAKKEQDGKLNPQEQSAVAEARGVLSSEQGEALASAPSQARDAEYMAAVEAGDMEKVQRMVDEAAKAAGYSNVGLHGTNAHAYSPGETITVFNTRPMSGRGAAFFTSSDKLAGEYGQKVYRTYLKLTNPLAVDVGGQHWSNLAPDTKVNANVTSELAAKKEKTNEGLNKIMFDLFGAEPSAFDPAKIKVESLSDITGEGGHMETDQVAKKARMLGYDGVIFKGVKDSPTAGSFYAHEPSDVFAVFNPNQIKSADPVTRDESGAVIPLSQRFNPASDSILFSSPSRRTPKAKADNQKALKDMIASMRPIWRDTLQATMIDGKSIAEFAQERGLPEETVGRILRDATGRLQFLQRTAEKGLKPTVQVQDDKVKASSGRPDLAMSGNSVMAAIDQNRPMPEVVHQAEMRELADALFTGWPDETLALTKRWMDAGGMMSIPSNLPKGMATILEEAAARNASSMLMQAAANHALNASRLNNASPAEQVRLGVAFRELGTEQARALGMRQDTIHDPMERHALYVQKVLFSPTNEQLAAIKNNPANRDRILANIEAEALRTKENLKAAGYDIDSWFQEQRELKKEGDAMIPPEVKKPLSILKDREREAVKSLIQGATWADAAAAAKTTVAALQDAYTRFYEAVNAAGTQAATEARDNILRSAPAGDYASSLGLPPPPKGVIDPNYRLVDTPKARTYQKKREKAALNDSALVAAAVNEASAGKSGWLDKASEYWRMSILSGPQTWVVNASSGVAFGLYRQMVQKLGSAGMASLIRTLGISDLPGAPALSDAPTILKVAWETFIPSVRTAMRSWKLNRRLFNAYANGNLNLDPGEKVWTPQKAGLVTDDGKEVGQMKGEKFRAPALSRNKWWKPGNLLDVVSFRMLLIADEFVRSWYGRIELAGIMRGLARSEPQLRKRTDELRAKVKAIMPKGWELRWSAANGNYYAVQEVERMVSERVSNDDWTDKIPANIRESLALNGQDLKKHGGLTKLLADGATQAQLEARMKELSKPGEAAWVEAIESADTITFQNPIGKGVRAIDSIDGLADLIQTGKESKYAAIRYPFQFVFPFVATPLNIFKTGISMSPVGGLFALIDAIRAWKKRGAGDMEQARQIMDASRALEEMVNQVVAWGLVLVVSEMVEDDDDGKGPRITGTSQWRTTSPGERGIANQAAPAQSIRIMDRWLSYKRLDPGATLLANIVDSVLAFRNSDNAVDALSTIGIRAIEATEEKTFVQGVSDLMNFVRDPKRYGARWGTNIATGFVPNLIRQPIRTADDTYRDTDLPKDLPFWEVIGRKVGYSVIPQNAPPSFDVMGKQEIKNTGTGMPMTDWIVRLLSPVEIRSAEGVDPLVLKLHRYNSTAEKPFGMTAPDREFTRTINGEKITGQLTSEEIKTAGAAARIAIGDRYNQGDLTEDDVKEISDVFSFYHKSFKDLSMIKQLQNRK